MMIKWLQMQYFVLFNELVLYLFSQTIFSICKLIFVNATLAFTHVRKCNIKFKFASANRNFKLV